MASKRYHPRPKRREQSDRVMDTVTPLRMASEDLELVRSAAAAADLPVSTFIRYAALGTAIADPVVRERVMAGAGAAIPT